MVHKVKPEEWNGGMMEWWGGRRKAYGKRRKALGWRLDERLKNFGFLNADCGYKSEESGARREWRLKNHATLYVTCRYLRGTKLSTFKLIWPAIRLKWASA